MDNTPETLAPAATGAGACGGEAGGSEGGGLLQAMSETDKRVVLAAGTARLRRWGLTGADKDLVVETIRTILAPGSKSSTRTRIMAGRLAKEIEGQNQADDHLEAKWGRIDAGKATDGVRIQAVREELPPLPALPDMGGVEDG